MLFELTGLGNPVLERLVAEGLAPDLLVTRAERGPYPYETLPFIGDVASRFGVPHRLDATGESDVAAGGAALLLVATYHRKIGTSVLSACGTAINLHPALLPLNRGPNPFFWSIYNGDAVTGVTAHALTEGLDEGAICGQLSLQVAADETQTSLRRKLGTVAADLAVSTVRLARAGGLAFRPQEDANATRYPHVGEEHLQIDLSQPADRVRRHVNALRDWPLARLGGRRIGRILAVAPRTAGPANPAETPSTLWAAAADADILFELDAATRAGN